MNVHGGHFAPRVTGTLALRTDPFFIIAHVNLLVDPGFRMSTLLSKKCGPQGPETRAMAPRGQAFQAISGRANKAVAPGVHPEENQRRARKARSSPWEEMS